MKKYLIFLFVFIALFGCKKNSSNPVQPAGRTGIITMTINTYSFDTLANKWKDTPNQTSTVKADLSKSYRKFYEFDECFGKNWQKGQNFENVGILLEGTSNDLVNKEIHTTVCTYDCQGYLISQNETTDGIMSAKTVYNVNNGKVLLEEGFGLNNVKKYTTVYEYDNSGYISKQTYTNLESNVITTTTYAHDAQEYVFKKTTSYDKYNFSTIYEYNPQGLLVKETSDWGSIKIYQYNSSGLVTKTIEEDNSSIYTETTTYDSYGFPVEIIDEYKAKDNSYRSLDKVVIKY